MYLTVSNTNCRCFVTSCVVCNITDVLWCHRQFATTQVFCDIIGSLQCHRCFVKSQVIS